MRTLASLGMGEGQLCSCAVVVLCNVGAVLEMLELMSQLPFFGKRMLKNGRGEERGYWLLQ